MRCHFDTARSAAVAVALFGAGLLLDVSLPSGTQPLTIGASQAEARIGRPATPGSVAGVARRTSRRVYRRSHY